MDRRGWPWKKKSSEKHSTLKPASPSDSDGTSLARAASLGNQDYQKANYVQISLDSYKHLSGLEVQVDSLENQVKTLEYQVKDLEGKLSAAHLELSNKENLVKQQAKVAEEAVSGWEKADAEAHALRQQLESVTLLKLTAEERVSHLDDALKECTRQIRNVKEESDVKLQETILSKTKQWDKLKFDLEAKLFELDRGLLQASAENAALSRSLQDNLNTIMVLNEEKSRAEAEVELFKGNIQLRDKEISSLKYELHVLSKEVDIRNQEKDMNLKVTEAANKQRLEDVKRIKKLEAECERLRGLVRKKLPGPGALARMKSEVDSKIHLANDNMKQCNKESEFQGKHLLEVEEEIKTLKEALAACNFELQSSRSMCAKATSRIKILEAQIHALNQQVKSSGSGLQIEGFSSQVERTPPSVTSISEDGIDEEGSSTESWGPLVSDISQLWKDKSIDTPTKLSSVNPMELMDDFLEMEKLACSSADSNTSKTGLDSSKSTEEKYGGHEDKDESCIQDPNGMKLQWQETEQLLAALRLQLESSQSSHSLAEVQLKCMTESYKLLEMRAHSLEVELKDVHDKAEKLEKELFEEKHSHQDTLAKLKELQQKFERDLQCSVDSLSTAANTSFKAKQEKEIAMAAEKLAECQETIHLLSKQLQALQQNSDPQGLQQAPESTSPKTG